MALISSGTFAMGTNDEMFSDAQPVHAVTLKSFLIDRTEVTNADFDVFVSATHHKTTAERAPTEQELPGVPKEALVAGSAAFVPPKHDVPLDDSNQWWTFLPGANWRHPEGLGSSIAGRMNHPVVHVSWIDAQAYCHWKEKRLPTEAEWEFAARGGLQGKRFAWGDEVQPQGKWQANVWQGKFPSENSRADGFEGTSPVKSYQPNGYGLYDVAGNVWEWCNDLYRADHYAHSTGKDPLGPQDSFDPDEPNAVKRVQRGGSFLCSDLYCVRYVVGARGKGEVNTSSAHLGFRCARDAEKQH
jgi:formylglycine-generating enzyme